MSTPEVSFPPGETFRRGTTKVDTTKQMVQSAPRSHRIINDVRILFIGGVIARDLDVPTVDVTEYGAPDNAANVYQWNMINGLERQLGMPVQVISAPFVARPPGSGLPRRVKGFEWRHGESPKDVSVGFVNILGVRNVTRELAMRRAITRWLDADVTDDGRNLLVFVYAMHGPFLQQLRLIKRRRPLAEICLVVPDLPQHMRDMSHASPLMKALKRIDMRRNKDCLEYVDRYVLISAHQATELDLDDRTFLVVEGMVETRTSEASQELTPAPGLERRPFRIVYTGQLLERYGIKDLVDSLDHLHTTDVELVVCGDGQMRDYLAERSAVDPRVTWLGRVSRDEALGWQASADALVNPRQGGADYTKFSFPSKNLEYLYSGKPVIAYRAEGTPPEYDDHVIYISEPGPEGIARAIEQVMAMPDTQRRAIGERAREFIETEKSVDRQMGRVLAFVGSPG